MNAPITGPVADKVVRSRKTEFGLARLIAFAILTTFGWTLGVIVLFLTLVPIFFSPYAFGKSVLMIVVGGIAGWFQWLVIKYRLPIERGRWLKATVLGLALGFVLGGLLIGNGPNISWPKDGTDIFYWGRWLGWTTHNLKVFAIAGLVLGLVQWYVMRPMVRNTLWLGILGLVGGALAGGIEGHFIDDCIQGYGYTTNGLGERLFCGSFMGFPLAVTVFGAVMSLGLAVVIVQTELQKMTPQTPLQL